MPIAVENEITVAYRQSLVDLRKEYQEYLPLTLSIQQDLRDDADEIRAQEGWDASVSRGIEAWLDDTETIFRFLKRNDWKEEKVYPVLLDALQNRVSKNLHLPIPSIPPYSTSDLFYILPLPQYTDLLGRPVCVITCRSIARDANGGLEDLVEWVWWCCEMLRRTLHDYWTKKRWGGKSGHGGEGCVVIVDAAGAGYRNLEVELLPNLAKVGSKNFPGMMQSIFVVNAGWTQRSLWKVVKPIIPSRAIDRIKFIDSPAELSRYFNLDNLPVALGGKNEWAFSAEDNPNLQYYSSHSLSNSLVPASATPKMSAAPPEMGNHVPIRNASFASSADLFYTAQNTPAASRRGSVSNINGLRMTRSYHNLPTSGRQLNMTRVDAHSQPPSNLTSGASTPIASSEPSQPEQKSVNASSNDITSMTPLQRIRSLADFKLYLSPSRRAQVELLDSDSEDEGPTRKVVIHPILQRRRILRPVAFEPEKFLSGSLIGRRDRPPLRLLGIPNHMMKPEDCRRSYSDLLVRHHAEELQKLDSVASTLALWSQRNNGVDNDSTDESKMPVPPQPSDSSDPSTEKQPPQGTDPSIQTISAFSRSLNPYYGYPVIRLPDPSHPQSSSTIIQPKYSRRRKRDLLKTLLFLFLLRLQSIRDNIERKLGLNRLLPWTGGDSANKKYIKAKNPLEGFERERGRTEGAECGRGKIVKRTKVSDWIWAIVGLALVRGGWVRILVWPLELMGLQGAREILGA